MSRRTAVLYASAIVALPIAAIIGIAAPLWLGLTNLAILGLYFAIPMLVSPVIVRRVWTDRTRSHSFITFVDWRALSILFHVVLSVLVLVVAVSDVRPTTFFLGIGVLYTLCFLLAVSVDGNASQSVVLYHIVIALLLVIFSVTLKYGFFVGRTDLSTHIALTNEVIKTGSSPTQVPEYEPFTLWHTLTAATYQVFGGWLTPHATMYLVSGLVFGAGVPTMYSFSRRVYPNKRVGLLSCLLLISFPLYIFYGMYSIPRSITSVLFLGLLLAIVTPPSPRTKALSLLFLIGITVYHTVSIPFVLVILLLLFVTERLLGRRARIVDSFVLTSAVLITSIYWLYRAEFIITRIAGAIVTSFFGTAEETAPSSVLTEPWVELANYAQYALLLGFVLLGVLFWLRSTRTHDSTFVAVGLLTVLMVPLIFPGPTLLLDSLVGVNVGRFGHYSFMLVSITGAVGLHYLLKLGGFRTFVVLLVVISCLSVTAVSNDFVATDNPMVERPFYTYYLTDQERQSFETIDDHQTGEIGADRVTCRYLREMHSSECARIDVADDNLFDGYDGVIIREGELTRRPLQFTEYVYADELPWEELDDRNRVYDSGSVSFYA
ncbi:hypothetical protein [Natronorubrum thiooxidans]|uniref:Dolichyl-phosphate-mannose-protein mannosyltransferase n=1 Tax=Natronorubrum thiooxidans TaxID=308853 RepID=A0A1N7FS94_9EURY|nr:hypothetical protein [Natronorubrum thiooxidans]SIS03115.1 hypothetical protein SAMN05421752_10826 [Natronorubrum thiooxidans]